MKKIGRGIKMISAVSSHPGRVVACSASMWGDPGSNPGGVGLESVFAKKKNYQVKLCFDYYDSRGFELSDFRWKSKRRKRRRPEEPRDASNTTGDS